jgi:hypothetical protein
MTRGKRVVREQDAPAGRSRSKRAHAPAGRAGNMNRNAATVRNRKRRSARRK